MVAHPPAPNIFNIHARNSHCSRQMVEMLSLDIFCIFFPHAVSGRHLPRTYRYWHLIRANCVHQMEWKSMNAETTHNDDVESFPLFLRLLVANMQNISTQPFGCAWFFLSIFSPDSGERKTFSHISVRHRGTQHALNCVAYWRIRGAVWWVKTHGKSDIDAKIRRCSINAW